MRNESGRSLVEMMGTLAIMGILAIAGIWMYNSTMDKLKANTIVNEAQKRAVVVAGQIGFQGRTNPSLGEFSDNTFSGGTFSTEVVTNRLYGQFGIQVSGVSKRVCQNILTSIGEDTAIRRLTSVGNPTTAMTSCADTNTFLMIYNNDMSGGENDVQYTSESCGCQTACGQCVMNGNTPTCVNECPAGGNTCSSNADCPGDCMGCVIPSGQSQGTCQACQMVTYLESTGTQYIDTEMTLDADTVSEGEFELVESYSNYSYSPFGAGQTGGSPSHRLCFNQGYVTFWNAYSWIGSTVPATANTRINFKIEKKVFTVNGQEKSYTSIAQTGNEPAYMFAYRNLSTQKAAGFVKIKFYNLKMTKNNALIRDFIPVHAPFQPESKQNCMFDRVSGNLFCNAATGSDFNTN